MQFIIQTMRLGSAWERSQDGAFTSTTSTFTEQDPDFWNSQVYAQMHDQGFMGLLDSSC
jgi:hypothetical protein